MRRLVINCNDATFLMAKKEEGKLGLQKRLVLFMHTAMCKFCRRFNKQMRMVKNESVNIQGQEASVNAEILIRLESKVNQALNNRQQ